MKDKRRRKTRTPSVARLYNCELQGDELKRIWKETVVSSDIRLEGSRKSKKSNRELGKPSGTRTVYLPYKILQLQYYKGEICF
jgi:hypothetical protein